MTLKQLDQICLKENNKIHHQTFGKNLNFWRKEAGKMEVGYNYSHQWV